MLTEEEARKKWCPVAWESHEVFRDDQTGQFEHATRTACVASRCMMWRWSDHVPRETMRLRVDATEIDGLPVVRAGRIRVVKDERWLYEHTDCDEHGKFELLHRAAAEDAERAGFCGLAGKP
jgi:hypothetical protein